MFVVRSVLVLLFVVCCLLSVVSVLIILVFAVRCMLSVDRCCYSVMRVVVVCFVLVVVIAFVC